MKKGPPSIPVPCCWPCCCFGRRVEEPAETEPSRLEQARTHDDPPRDASSSKDDLPELPEKSFQRGRQELETPRSPANDDASVASTAINTALRFPSPARSEENRPSLETLPEDDLGEAPPSYDSVWRNNEKRTS